MFLCVAVSFVLLLVPFDDVSSLLDQGWSSGKTV